MIPLYDLCISNDTKDRLYFTYQLNSRKPVNEKNQGIPENLEKRLFILVLLSDEKLFD